MAPKKEKQDKKAVKPAKSVKRVKVQDDDECELEPDDMGTKSTMQGDTNLKQSMTRRKRSVQAQADYVEDSDEINDLIQKLSKAEPSSEESEADINQHESSDDECDQ